MIDIRQPNISADTPDQQLLQMRSYLYQLAQQLNWAFSTVSAGDGGSSSGTPQTQTVTVAGNAKIDPQKTFAALKDLIIKSADIVNAYYDEINTKLSGVYVAQSDFGTYAEQTEADISANSTGVSQLYENNRTILLNIQTLEGSMKDEFQRVDGAASDLFTEIERVDASTNTLSGTVGRLETNTQSLSDSIGDLETNAQNLSNTVGQIADSTASMAETVDALYAATVETNAYIKTGMLYEDDHGIPVYGLEVGQTNDVNGVNVFTKFARFSSDRLSFYDRNDTEVAFISDYRLYISNAEVTGALTLTGKFKIFYDHGLAFQWIGGNA